MELLEKDIEYRAKKHKICIAIPTYNNAATLPALLDALKQFGNDLIVVNDGCTDGTAEILSNYEAFRIITHDKNLGKGRALQSAFDLAINEGYDIVITLDSDGQHMVSDIPQFLVEIENGFKGLIVGCRNLENAGQPKKNSFANKFANFWFYVETGQSVADTQSGFRAYPLNEIKSMKFSTRHYDFELEVLVKSAWRGTEIREIPIQVYYPPAEEKVTHFKPFLDFFRISVLNVRLLILAIFWYRPWLFFKTLSISNFRKSIHHAFSDPTESSVAKSNAVALGVLFGILPIWGYQMVAALFLAFVLKLNKAIVFVAAQISLPPMIPFILYGSVLLGEKITGQTFHLHFSEINIQSVKQHIYVYISGAVALSAIAAVFAWGLSYLLFSYFKQKKRA